MILVDTNIIMYAVGRDHPAKEACARLVRAVGAGQVKAAIDAEILQEVLHRYRSIREWQQGEVAYRLARETFASILEVTAEVMDGAFGLMRAYPHLTARDAVHLAVMQLNGLDGICSYDRDFDAVAGVRRVEPPSLLPLRH